MRDARRIHERLEVRLDRPQVIWLTLGVIVLLAVSFALGLVAGRRAERLVQTDTSSQSPDPIAAVDGASDEHEKLTFYRELKDEPAVAEVAPKPKPKTAAPLRQAQQPRTPRATAPESASRTRQPAAKPKKKAPAQKRGDVREKMNEGPADRGQYTVQVSAFQSMDEAEAYAASLERKGYAPFITQASIPKKGTWYRVRMGAFDNELEATLAKQILARKDIPAWVLKTD